MRLIDADALGRDAFHIKQFGKGIRCVVDWDDIEAAPTVEAVILPCKVGDHVWFVGTSNTNRLKAGIIETTVEKLVLKSGGIYMKLSCNAMYETSCRSIGKSVFFTREEAEAAIAKMGGDPDV